MASRLRNGRMNENEGDKVVHKKLVGKNDAAPKAARRPALGDLGNRVLRSSTTTLKDTQGKLPDLKNVKPRVDTFWKKTDLPAKVLRKPSESRKISGHTDILELKPSIVEKKHLSPVKVAPLAQPEIDFKVEETKCHSNILLQDVIDIDAEDHENLLHMAEYVNDIYSYLMDLEMEYPIKKNYLDGHTDLRPRMRYVLIDWINEVHNQFHLVPETYHMCVALIDRYLEQRKNLSRKMLQLVGITALFLASKYEEVMPPSIYDFVHIADNSYTDKQVRLMEMQMLERMQFNLSRPLPIHFLRRFSKAAYATEIIHGAAKYFLELVSLEYAMCHLRPSIVAAASIYLALRILRPTEDTVWTTTLQFYAKYTEDEVLTVAKDIAILVVAAPTSKHHLQAPTAIFTKYKSKKYGEVSTLPEMNGDAIRDIINS